MRSIRQAYQLNESRACGLVGITRCIKTVSKLGEVAGRVSGNWAADSSQRRYPA